MKKEEIKFADWSRIFIGEVPGVFFLEVVLRTLVVYLIIVVGFRMMGSRMASRLNRIEQAALVTLAAAIGVPIQSPERGLLPAVIIALLVVLSGRLIARWSVLHKGFEMRSQGRIDTLVKNGVLLIEKLKHTTLSRERVFAQLRCEQIVHLGQVERFYLEANGSFTLVRMRNEIAGLSIIPEHDSAFTAQFSRSQKIVCAKCGAATRKHKGCKNCGKSDSQPAITVQ